jgi:hypothetical protein
VPGLDHPLIGRLALVSALAAMAAAPAAGAAAREPAPPSPSARAAALWPVKVVTVNGTAYAAGDVVTFAQRITKTTSIRIVLNLIKACRNAGAWGFISSRGAGIVAWAPTRLGRCWGPMGGGPAFSPCLQGFTTPATPDPLGLGRGGFPQYRVLIAATNTATCADMSTQVPGGVWGRTGVAFRGYPAGSPMMVTCQYTDAQGYLRDYVATGVQTVPRSRAALWFYDAYFETGGDRMDGVPGCSGLSMSF